MKTVDPPAERFAPRRLLATTFLGRCPVCQRGSVFAGVYRTREACAVCGARFERSEGNWTGPVVVAYGVACAAAFLAGALLVARAGFAPWVMWAIVGVACAAALLAYRPAKAWWVWLLWATGIVFVDSD